MKVRLSEVIASLWVICVVEEAVFSLTAFGRDPGFSDRGIGGSWIELIVFPCTPVVSGHRSGGYNYQKRVTVCRKSFLGVADNIPRWGIRAKRARSKCVC